MVDTSNEWIIERTGIRERRLAAPREAASDLGAEAARRALDDAGLRPADIDLILVSTATPDHLFPSTSCIIQKLLGARRAAAMDITAACTGFIYGLGVAEGLLARGRFGTILLVATELLSRITDYKDRSTCVLFGDAAGAVVLRRADAASAGLRRSGGPRREGASPNAPGLLSVFLSADGRGDGILSLPAGGSRLPTSRETVDARQHFIHMDGQEVFRFAVGAMVKAFRESLRAARLKAEDLDLVVPHQANSRIVDAATRLLGLDPRKVFHTIERYGNVSSASIPLSLDEARRQGRLKDGDLVALVAFGAGLTFGGAVLRWGWVGPGRRQDQ